MIEIRAAGAKDAKAIAELYAPYVANSGIALDAEPPGAEEMAARIGATGAHPWLVAVETEDKRVLGYAHAYPFRERPAYRWTVETAIHLAPDVKPGKGTGRLLYGALVATLKAQGFTQAISGIALPNDRMITLHEQVGFRRAGVYREAGYARGQWVDVGFWQCSLAEPNEPPDEPEGFASVGVVRG